MNALTLDILDHVATVTLRRPEARNALTGELIAELAAAFAEIAADRAVRTVVLAGEGKAFCAGADMKWMRRMVDVGEEENIADALAMARMYRAIYLCPKPVIARVQGAAFGGGAGLVAVCDLAVGTEETVLCFSEARIGIAPAIISPFVLRKLGAGATRRYFVTAERISAPEALRIGLLSDVVPAGELDARIAERAAGLRENGPEAMAACKRLVEEVYGPIEEALLEKVSRRIAELRASEEGVAGMQAFLEKRAAPWAERN